MNPRRAIAIVISLLVAALAGAGITVSSYAQGSGPPVTLSPTSGAPGTTITVTLPQLCTVPASAGFSDPGALTLFIEQLSGSEVALADQQYNGDPGVALTQAVIAVPVGIPSGHYAVTGECDANPTASVVYGDAVFDVTGGGSAPPATVTPTSGAPGTTITVSAPCPSSADNTSALDAALFSATSPTIDVSNTTSGFGPNLTLTLQVPSYAPAGTYFVAVTCDEYTTQVQFAETTFTVTGASAGTTTLSAVLGSGQTGTAITVPAGTPVTDTATLSGSDVGGATGTITYTLYSDSACTAAVNSGGTIPVTGGVVPPSNPVIVTTPGTYYWQASYSGDGTNQAATTACGAPGTVETVTAAPTTAVTGNVAACVAGTPCTIALTGTGFGPDEQVDIVLHSTSIDLGTATTDADGTFMQSVSIPTTTPAGSHQIVATGETSGKTASFPLTIDPAAPPPTSATATSGSAAPSTPAPTSKTPSATTAAARTAAPPTSAAAVTRSSSTLAFTGPGLALLWVALIGSLLVFAGAGVLIVSGAPPVSQLALGMVGAGRRVGVDRHPAPPAARGIGPVASAPEAGRSLTRRIARTVSWLFGR